MASTTLDRPGSEKSSEQRRAPSTTTDHDTYVDSAGTDDERAAKDDGAVVKGEPEGTPAGNNDTTDAEKGISDASPAVDGELEYPTGSRLVFVVIALALSIFLVSLDMVSSCDRDAVHSRHCLADLGDDC
jgi:hypothetical protein